MCLETILIYNAFAILDTGMALRAVIFFQWGWSRGPSLFLQWVRGRSDG